MVADVDPKTKQLVKEAEARIKQFSDLDKLFSRHAIPRHIFADVYALCSAVREQDKRARHAEQERDAFDKRIAELERELASAKAHGTNEGYRADRLAHLLAYAADTLENVAGIMEDDDIDKETPAVREHIIEMWELLGNDEGVKRVKEAMAKAPRMEW